MYPDNGRTVSLVIEHGKDLDYQCPPYTVYGRSVFDHLGEELVDLLMFENRSRLLCGLVCCLFTPETGRILDLDFVIGPEMTKVSQSRHFRKLCSYFCRFFG